MMKFKGKNIEVICKDIDLIIAGRDNKSDYKFIFLHIEDAISREMSYAEIVLICETARKIATTKNRILRNIEKDFWNLINRIPLRIIVIKGLKIKKNEELLANDRVQRTK